MSEKKFLQDLSEESEIKPKAWYNVRADMKPAPLLNWRR